MNRTTRGWIAQLAQMTKALSAADAVALQGRAGEPPLSGRVGLGLRIALSRRRAAGKPPAPATIIALAPVPAEPVTDAAETPPAEPPKPQRRAKKVSFSAVSLHDAASLLTAFGQTGDEAPGRPAPDTPAAEEAAPRATTFGEPEAPDGSDSSPKSGATPTIAKN